MNFIDGLINKEQEHYEEPDEYIGDNEPDCQEDFRDYLKTKSTHFLVSLKKTGLKALGSERHNQVKEELTNREIQKIMEREKEHHLALWCMEQSKLYSEGQLSKDKVKKLKDVNFPFDYYLALYDRCNMTFEEFEKED